MPLLVTSASGANGNGYGTLLAFDLNGRSLGAFSGDSRIADPRGLAVDRDEGLLFLNSGTDRVLALDPNGRVVRDSGPIEGLNPGGANFGPDGRYYVGARSARTIMAFSIGLGATGEYVLPAGIVPFPRGFAFGRDGRLFLASGIGPNGVRPILVRGDIETNRHGVGHGRFIGRFNIETFIVSPAGEPSWIAFNHTFPDVSRS